MSSQRTVVKLHFHSDFLRNEAVKNKMIEAVKEIEATINTAHFKKLILNYVYDGKKQFAQTSDLNTTVYRNILEGKETLSPELDNEWDLAVIPYYKNNNVVGYTYPSRNEVWVNLKFYYKYEVSQIANNLAHEYMHKIGYGHDFRRTKRRNYSVPYAVGRIVQNIIEAKRTPVAHKPETRKTSSLKKMGIFRRAWFKFISLFS
jgi:hypothetical protein